ncbi:hypothetical protein AB0M64_25120 [Streptomyces sp. NPDC051771]|uniref:hypothetical protein n=1 Tax=Streptomyces sp. NPDC051771 TaxID=3154847 RepID=UPI00342B39A8
MVVLPLAELSAALSLVDQSGHQVERGLMLIVLGAVDGEGGVASRVDQLGAAACCRCGPRSELRGFGGRHAQCCLYQIEVDEWVVRLRDFSGDDEHQFGIGFCDSGEVGRCRPVGVRDLVPVFVDHDGWVIREEPLPAQRSEPRRGREVGKEGLPGQVVLGKVRTQALRVPVGGLPCGGQLLQPVHGRQVVALEGVEDCVQHVLQCVDTLQNPCVHGPRLLEVHSVRGTVQFADSPEPCLACQRCLLDAQGSQDRLNCLFVGSAGSLFPGDAGLVGQKYGPDGAFQFPEQVEDQHGPATELEVVIDQAAHVLEQGGWARAKMLQPLKNSFPAVGSVVGRRSGEVERLCHFPIMPGLAVFCRSAEAITLL